MEPFQISKMLGTICVRSNVKKFKNNVNTFSINNLKIILNILFKNNTLNQLVKMPLKYASLISVKNLLDKCRFVLNMKNNLNKE